MAVDTLNENIRDLNIAFASGYMADIWSEVLSETAELSDAEVWSTFIGRILDDGLLQTDPAYANELLFVNALCGQVLPDDLVLQMAKDSQNQYYCYLLKKGFYENLYPCLKDNAKLPQSYREPIEFPVRGLCEVVGMLEFAALGISVRHLPNNGGLIELKRRKYGFDKEEILSKVERCSDISAAVIHVTGKVIERLVSNGVPPREIADLINTRFNPNLNREKIPVGRLAAAREFWVVLQTAVERSAVGQYLHPRRNKVRSRS